MGDDWDLEAVVRGCRATTRDPFSSFPAVECGKVELTSLETTVAGGGGGDGLFELCRSFIQRPHQPLQGNVHRSSTAATVSGGQRQRQAAGHIPRAKKRKNQQRKVVCEVPADGVSADLWAWRKYGQKPIKGSPFPRGYYRCSSLKGCPARKQVERNPKDPGLLMITYTAEHSHPVPTHRNSLAGSTRGQKLPSSSHGGLSPTTPLEDELLDSPSRPCKSEEEEGESEELLVEDMELMGEDEFLFLGGELANVATSSTWSSGAAVPGNR